MSRAAKIGFGVLLALSLALACGLSIWLSCIHVVEGGERARRYLDRVAPIGAAIDRGEAPDALLLRELAENRVTRAYLFDALHERGRLELMPPEHASLEARAEADLARWLTYPTELDAEPDRMELVARAYIEEGAQGPMQYLAFRFTAPAGHWAADHGWMFGISGPWPLREGQSIEDHAGVATFSELEEYDDDRFRVMVAEMHGRQVSGTEIPTASIRVESAP